MIALLEDLHAACTRGDCGPARDFVCNHMPEWFERHRQSMDAATAAFARAVA